MIGAPYRGAHAQLTNACRGGAGSFVVVVHSGHAAGAHHRRHDVLAVKRKPLADKTVRQSGRVASGDEGGRAFRLQAAETRVVHTEAVRQLVGHRGEHLRCRNAARDQRRHPPQRCLLLDKHPEIGSGLCVGDGGCHEIGEVAQAGLGVGWQWLALRGADDRRAPQVPVDDDRRANDRTDARGADAFGLRTADVVVAVDPRGAAGAQHHRSDIVARQRNALTGDRHVRNARLVLDVNDTSAAIGLVAKQPCVDRVETTGQFVGHRREDLGGVGTARNQRRHPP